MKKFEYQIVRPSSLTDAGTRLVDVLNDLGDDGWELVHVTTRTAGREEKWTLMRERQPGSTKSDRRMG